MRSKKAHARYHPDEIAAALVALEAAGGNVNATATQLGIPPRTFHRWVKIHLKPSESYIQGVRDRSERITKTAEVLRKDAAQRWEDHMHRALDAATPKKFKDADLRSVTWTVAVSVDKMRLLREQPPPSTEAELTAAETLRRSAEALAALVGVSVEQAIDRMKQIQIIEAEATIVDYLEDPKIEELARALMKQYGAPLPNARQWVPRRPTERQALALSLKHLEGFYGGAGFGVS